MPKSRNISLLYTMALLQGMVFCGPIATLYRLAVGVGLGQIALMEGISLALALLTLLPALACLTLAQTGSMLLSVLAVGAIRISFNLFQPLQNVIQNRVVRTKDRATALSVHAVLLDGATISAALLFGRLSKVRLSAAFLLGALLCLGALGLTGLLAKE